VSSFIIASYALALPASAWLWWSIVPRWWRSRDTFAGPAQPWNPVATCLTAAWVVLHLQSVFLSSRDTPEPATLKSVQQNCLFSSMAFVVLMTVVASTGWTRLREMGFEFRGAGQQVRVGFLAFVAALLPVFIVQMCMLPFRTPEAEHPMLKLLESNQAAAVLTWIVLAAVVVAPLIEELMYRVILQPAFGTQLPPVASVIASSVIFSAVHGWPDMVPLFPLAFVLGAVYRGERSYLACVTAHAAFNGWMLIHALLSAA
jgi:membrane protease YdiL (CAAX protease family)